MRADALARTCAPAYARMRVRLQGHPHARTRLHQHASRRACMLAQTCTWARARRSTHAPKHLFTHTHAFNDMRRHAYALMHTSAHTHTRTHAYAYTCTRPHAYMRTGTHTHKWSLSVIISHRASFVLISLHQSNQNQFPKEWGADQNKGLEKKKVNRFSSSHCLDWKKPLQKG